MARWNLKCILLPLLFLGFIIFSTTAVPVQDINVDDDLNTASRPLPEGRQGILEIPKQAATIIRNFIDRNLAAYLNLTTPKPDPNYPSVIGDSILAHYVLQPLILTPAPVPLYTRPQPQPVKPITQVAEVAKEPVKTRPVNAVPAVAPDNTVKATAAPNKDANFPDLYNSHGVLLNTPDEVYYISPTKASIVIPVETSTQVTTEADPDAEANTEESAKEKEDATTEAVKTTTEDDDDEETDIDFTFNNFNNLKA